MIIGLILQGMLINYLSFLLFVLHVYVLYVPCLFSFIIHVCTRCST